jgi:hypothetical protein
MVASRVRVSNATVGDCRSEQCDGKGTLLTMVEDDTDLPADDGNACTDDLCRSGVPSHPAKAPGTACGPAGGGLQCDTTPACANPPALVSLVPADGSMVLVGTPVAMTFSTAMNPATLAGQASAGLCSGSVQLSLNDFATCISLVGPVMSAGNTVATFTAAPGFLASRTYKVRVTTGAQGTTGLAIAAAFTMPTGFQTKSPDSCEGSVVISQIYGGGGSSASDTPYQSDYVQLHNRGAGMVDLAGYSLQYAAATGDVWSSVVLSGTVPAGSFFLVQLGAAGSQGQALPTPDISSNNVSLSATTGKVALVRGSAAMPRDKCPSSDAVDFVAYGATTCSRSSTSGANAAPALTYLGALVRASSGCVNTNVNASDFSVATPSPTGKSGSATACACPPLILDESGNSYEADLCNTQSPFSLSVQAGAATPGILGQVLKAGLTDASGAAAAIRAQLGVGPVNRNPEYESGWTWTDAAYDAQVGNVDQYAATFTSTIAGQYRYLYRFSLDGGNSWTYCDNAQGDGGAGSDPGLTFDLENIGLLTVTP